MHEFVDTYAGYLAGLATSLLWTCTSLVFTAAGRRLGVTFVNGGRILLAILLLATTLRLTAGSWWPPVQMRQVALLGASGIIGLAIGDQALLTSFLDIGPRRASLIMTAAPLFAALFGWVALNERLSVTAWLGIVATVGGVAWVIAERRESEFGAHPPRAARGYGLALLAAACQAGGLLLSKEGMGHGWLLREQMLSPQPAALVRMTFAGAVMVPLLGMRIWREMQRRRAGLPRQTQGSRTAGVVLTTIGAVAGPYLGVWMSLIASDRAPLGIAQTFCSLTPIFILPFAAKMHGERITARSALGASVAVAGLGLLFLKPSE